MSVKTETIPMTNSARDALIPISVLWVLFLLTVGFRLLGRVRGIGLGADDILLAVFSGAAKDADIVMRVPSISRARAKPRIYRATFTVCMQSPFN